MPDPLDPAPREAPPYAPAPEVDPAATPQEVPAPASPPDDGFGRPIDGSVLGAGAIDGA